MLNVSEGKLLVLLLVMQAQSRAPRRFLINATRKKSVHPLVSDTLLGILGQDPYPVLRDPTGSAPDLGIADTFVQLCGALAPDLITTIAAAESEIVRRRLRRVHENPDGLNFP